MTDLVHRFGPAVAAPASPAPSVDHEDIQALMAPGSSVRTAEPETAQVAVPAAAVQAASPPNVYTPDEPTPAAAPNVYSADDEVQLPRTPNVYAALENLDEEHGQATATAVPRADRDAEWSAITTEAEGPDWTAMGAEPVGPDTLRWRREDDDIVPSGAAGSRRLPRLSLRRR